MEQANRDAIYSRMSRLRNSTSMMVWPVYEHEGVTLPLPSVRSTVLRAQTTTRREQEHERLGVTTLLFPASFHFFRGASLMPQRLCMEA